MKEHSTFFVVQEGLEIDIEKRRKRTAAPTARCPKLYLKIYQSAGYAVEYDHDTRDCFSILSQSIPNKHKMRGKHMQHART